ncbi:2-hydroxychromene-2-carboxylate isomerase [Pseudomonas fontis]|uniref:2-hydroxychromene-2-carboxylate isomerase n=1 Tax=Pseudomonas fontis TaxID=2942633 RepID=A0ABT5NM71_9PSED|nr:2-hydroxychromene-2-carboxylate isomerase [Pseudomonas fontis]MDD0976627.1 2-hydroxychromene-2-carboxylate isomerase [Pseudomonas fontis]MDD0988975.1 2-hydroxychromene-2-carboxylate isomerase [Pseudomonas fontis]
MSKTVECFFDLGSPASYLAWTQLPALCERHNAQMVWRPMLLGGVFQVTGNASPAAIPAKARYSLVDLQRYASRYGVPLHFSRYFPINTLTLMRGAIGMQLKHPQRFEAYLTAMFNGMWVEQQNLGDPQVLAQVLAAAGFSAQEFIALVADAEVKEALKVATTEAVQRGVFGAPTCFVDGEMFFGQDRLEFVESALA